MIECKGPTNTRVYTVAVYFQGKRLAKASGHSIQEAEMNSAKEALEKSQGIKFSIQSNIRKCNFYFILFIFFLQTYSHNWIIKSV